MKISKNPSLFESEDLFPNFRIFYPSQSERRRLEDKYCALLREDLKIASLVSYVGNKNIPFLRLYRYKEAFSYEFVKEYIKKFCKNKDSLIFDPFCGMGTTLFVSYTLGFPSIGIDKLPVAVFITKTLPLFFKLEKGILKDTYKKIKEKMKKSPLCHVAMDVPIMQVAFPPEGLEELRKIKSTIDKLNSPLKNIFLLLFFSILEECSYTSKDGQFLRLNKNKKVNRPIEALYRKVLQAEEDIKYAQYFFNQRVNKGKYYITQGDTRNLSKIQFPTKPNLLITSPPYANRYDYTRTYSLELCFHFVKNFEELREIRMNLLRSHIESKVYDEEPVPHEAVEEIIDLLSKRKLNNPKIPQMIKGYFIDMNKTILEWYKVLASGSTVVVVVDNVRFEGELVPVDLILSDLAERVGFKIKEIIIARYKGNSSQQMKKYGKVPVRESIVIWSKPNG